MKSYDFNGGLSDSLGNGNDLVASGGTTSGGRYHFGDDQGLRLTDALSDTSNYGIEFRFRFDDDVSGYGKLIDFQDLASDDGLYVLNNQVNFYPVGTTGGLMNAGTDYTVGVERKNDIVSVFLDGTLLFDFLDDTGFYAVSGGNILNFFQDDTPVSGESFAGSVDFVRIHTDSSTFGQSPAAVPEPLSATVWGVGLIGAFIARRRKASASRSQL